MLLRLVASADEHLHRRELDGESAERRVADVAERVGVLGARERDYLCRRAREQAGFVYVVLFHRVELHLVASREQEEGRGGRKEEKEEEVKRDEQMPSNDSSETHTHTHQERERERERE